ncbi:MAG: COX15/CtaA family protein [Nitriliruptoraceae bacterium]
MDTLRRFTLLAIVVNVGIVFTGGLVRLTGSGLGCPDWPSCTPDSLVPVPGGDHAGWQTAIEFGNRMLTFVVLASAIAVWVQVRRTRPHPRVVEVLAVALPAGVLAQAVVGGITVLTGLSPYTVATHFLLSMGLIATAVVLHDRTRAAHEPGATVSVRRTAAVLLVIAAVVLLLGTVVTSSGPHGGDPSAPRLALDIRMAALAHADAVWMLLGVTVALVAMTWNGPPRVRRAARILLAIELAQGSIGYAQYVLGVPAVLVGAHILGAALVWTTVVTLWIRTRPPTPSRIESTTSTP